MDILGKDRPCCRYRQSEFLHRMIHGIRHIRQAQKEICGHTEVLSRVNDHLGRHLLCVASYDSFQRCSVDVKDLCQFGILHIEPEEAKVVQMIFEMYGKQGIGYNTIAHNLNQMHISSRTGEWGQTSVANIINNEVYLGKIRLGKEPVKRVIKDGMVAKKRIQNDNYELYEGRHEPIITEDQWNMAKAAQKKRNHTPNHKDRQLRNPFASILVCGKCGAIMKRKTPKKDRSSILWYQCSTRGCDYKMIKCDTVENYIHDAMEEYILHINSEQQPVIDLIESSLEAIREQISALQLQQDELCEYLEKVTVYRSQDDELSIQLYPNLPK